MSLVDLSTLYDFPRGIHHFLDVMCQECSQVWNVIGVKKYSHRSTKSTYIRRPTLRYLYKALAHTLFARKETGTVTKEEIGFLVVGIKHFLQALNNGYGLRTNRDDMIYTALFVN